MNTMIYYSFSLLLLSLIVLIIGMFKPKWVFLWMDKPGRMAVVIFASALFMIGAVMFGEGNKQLKQEKAALSTPKTSEPAAEVPAPVTPPPPQQ